MPSALAYCANTLRNVVFAMQARSFAHVLPCVLLACFICARDARADELTIPFANIARSLVLIDNNGVDTGVGVVIDSSRNGSVVLTDAHVVSTNGTIASTVTIYRPPSGTPLATVPVLASDVDQESDLALLRLPIPNLQVACLRRGAPLPGRGMGLAAFTVKGFEVHDTPGSVTKSYRSTNSLPTVIESMYPIVRNGLVSGSDSKETEFIALLEAGFSGGPLFEAQTGLVFGLNQRSIQLANGPSNSLFSVSNRNFDGFINRHFPGFFPHVSVSDFQSRLYPDVARARRISISESQGITSLPKGFQDVLRYSISGTLGVFLDLAGVEVSVEPVQFERNEDKPFVMNGESPRQAYYNNLCALNKTIAVVLIDPELSGIGSDQKLSLRLSFANCDGDVFMTKSVAPVPVVRKVPLALSTPTAEYQLRNEVVDAMQSIDNIRSWNYFMYGIMMSNGERSAYFSLKKDSSGNIVADNVWPGGTASIGGLQDGSYIAAINDVSAERMKQMSSAELNSFVDTLNNSEERLFVLGRNNRRIGLSSANICGYLEVASLGVRSRHVLPLPH